jgi:hypothetical protein
MSEVVHDCPREGESVTRCCGRIPFELPRDDRMTLDPALVTCSTVQSGDPLADLQRAMFGDSRRTVYCAPEHEERIRAALDATGLGGLWTVNTSAYLPDEDTVLLVDEGALERYLRQSETSFSFDGQRARPVTTTVVFDVLSDDPKMQDALEPVRDDPVMLWRVAVFCCQQQLEKAIAVRAVRDHYDAIHLRARATRAARREVPDA